MTELFKLLEATEALVAEAEGNLDKLNIQQDEEQFRKVLLLAERCNVINHKILEQKEMILRILTRISLAIGKERYDKVGKSGRDYWVIKARNTNGVENQIGYSDSPRWSEVSICTFVANSRFVDSSGLDFKSFCLAIIKATAKYLKVAPREYRDQLTELEKLLIELRVLTRQKILYFEK